MPPIKHLMRRTTEYKCWVAMIARCHNENDSSYERYGARGIRVCDEWRRDFLKFYREIGPRPSREFTVDRIDNLRGYEPGNVRWATRLEQAKNRRSTSFHTFNGERLSVREISERTGVNVKTIKYRLTQGWPEHLAFTMPAGSLAPYQRWGEPRHVEGAHHEDHVI